MENIEDLKLDWVYLVNSFDEYEDKQEWNRLRKELEYKIEDYETKGNSKME